MMTIDYGAIVTIYLVTLLIALALYVWIALALSAMFRKAGQPASRAWIPIANIFTLAKISGRPESPWLLFVPLYNIYILWLIVTAVSNRFGRSNGFGFVGLFFFPIWASILGWGSARWMGVHRESAAPVDGGYAWTNPHQTDPAATGHDAAYGADAAASAYAQQSQQSQQSHLSWLDQNPPAPAQNTWDPFAPLGVSTPQAADTRAIPTVPPAPPAPSAYVSAPPAPPMPQDDDPWAPRATPPAPPAPSSDNPFAPATSDESAFAPPSFAAPPVPPLPAPPVVPADASALPTSLGNPGSTRMREDSEVVAQARRAQAMTPPPLPPLPVADDSPATPIVVPGARSTIPAPPVPLSGSVPIVEGVAFEDSEWMQNSLSTGIANVATPVSASSSVSTLVPDAAAGDDPWAPRLRRSGAEDEPSDEQSWDSAEVSAVSAVSAIESSVEVSAVAPATEAPRSALASVSAQRADAGVPSDEGFDDQTVVASRRRVYWNLNLPIGTSIALTSDYVILGRKPDDEPAFPSAQLISVADGTRTISKTHAVLAMVDGEWTITDLGSTNGVVLIDEAGAESELTPHEPARLTTRFLLGDAELTIEAASE